MDEDLPPIVLDPWHERVSLSAHDATGARLAPERAYAGMPEDARIAAAICDAALANHWDWVASVVLVILGEKEPSTSTRTQRYFERRGWKDIEDVYDAANVSKNQRVAFNLRLHNFTFREIGELMSITTHTAQMQCIRTVDKLRQVMKEEEQDNG